MKETPLGDLDLSVFAALVNSTFCVRQDAGEPIQLVLVEAKPILAGGADAASRARSFSLIFQGPERFPLPQKMHAFEHEKLGRFAMFIVPIGKGPGVFHYQAVFNRAG